VYKLSQKCIDKNLSSVFKLSTGKRKGTGNAIRDKSGTYKRNHGIPNPTHCAKEMLTALRILQIVLPKQTGRDNVEV